MTDEVTIANMALSAIGTRSTIQALTEASPEAVACNQWFDTTRTQLLRTALWGFARAFVNLALLKAAPGTAENPNPTPVSGWSTDFPPQPWLYEYAYPTDCIMARYVVPSSTQTLSGIPIFSTNNPQPWQALGPSVKSIVTWDAALGVKTICTDQSLATLCYTKDITNTDAWDAGFQQAMVYGLAAQIAIALTGDKQLSRVMAQNANNTILQARTAMANEALTTQNVVPDWIRVRGVNYGWDGYTQMLDSFGPLFVTPV